MSYVPEPELLPIAAWSPAAGAAIVSRAAQRITRFMADTSNLARIIAQALADARQRGLDHIGQTDHAIRAVLAARHDMTASAALQVVNRWRRG